MSVKDIYIKELVIDNYKSLKGSKIKLQQGLNIIIGKNGAGKSNLIQFVYGFVNRNTFVGLRGAKRESQKFRVIIEYTENRKKIELSLAFQKNRSLQESTSPELTHNYNITFNKKIGRISAIQNEKISFTEKGKRTSFQKNERLFKELDVLRLLKRTYIRFSFPQEIFWVSKPNRITFKSDDDVTFEEMFTELNLFSNLEWEIELEFFHSTTPKKKLRDVEFLKEGLIKFINNYFIKLEINEYLNKFTPIQEIRLNKNINVYSVEKNIIIENLMIDFLVGNEWMPWSYLSDGSKRLFYIITEILTVDNGIVLVEEPELGIHPHQLYKVLDFLKEQATNKQVIISTHSPIALDVLKENELSSIIIAKYENSCTTFEKLTQRQVNTAKRYMKDVGELSYYWLHSDLEND